MISSKKLVVAFAVFCAISTTAKFTDAHGFVGDRLFPATVTTDDPLATDELMLPAISMFSMPGGGAGGDDGGAESRVFTGGFEFDKVIIPKLAVGVSDDYLWQRPHGGPTAHGWDNLTVSAKYEVWRNEPHEAIFSVGLEAEIGGTGSQRIGRDPFTTFTPTMYFGKGFGDLPDTYWWARPMAVTGTVGLDLPTEAEANSIEWGLAVEYNIPYLQQHVRDVGMPAPFKDMIPLVEFAFDNPINRGEGRMTGTINPGVLWESRYMQVGVEALVPVNSESGSHVGVMVQFQIYIDDLFPAVFGHPIFGE